MKKLAAGNWKMNGTRAALAEVDGLGSDIVEVLICPPATLIAPLADRGARVLVGAQDCDPRDCGAHTGDLAASQLVDAGASHVIVGHSERRADHGESDADVAAKAIAAHQAGLTAVICVGETEAQRDAGETLDVIAAQIEGSVPDCATAANTVLAYEPVWAIGTGRTPDAAQIAEVHAAIRQSLARRFADAEGMRLLYGGSVKAGNAAEIFAIANVDGALVGGGSLKAADFAPIIAALEAAV